MIFDRAMKNLGNERAMVPEKMASLYPNFHRAKNNLE